MSNITKHLNNIKTATFGKDVRSSIHDAIEECYYTLGSENVTNENIGFNEISADKLRFGRLGKNKFTNDIQKNIVLGGEKPTYEYRESEGAVTCICKVEPKTQYTISIDTNLDRFRIGATTNYPKLGDSVRHLFQDDHVSSTTLTTGKEDNYLIIYVSSAGQGLVPAKLQVEEGDTKTSYSKPTLMLDYDDYSIPKKAVEVPNYRIGYQVGRDFNISLADQCVNIGLERSLIVCEDNRFFVNKGVYSFADVDANSICILVNGTTKEVEFCKTSELINKSNEYYYLGCINKDSSLVAFNGTYLLEGKSPYGQGEVAKSDSKKFYITNIPKSNYINTSSYISADLSSTGGSLNKIYAEWDKLVELEPNYVTKTLLGNDSAGLPIYKYEFKPFKPQVNSNGKKHPKILYFGGIHGHERYCNYTDLRFFNDLVKNWKTNDVLEMLRFNVHFIVVPVQSPWGYKNKSRVNVNGVNINRNHAHSWQLTSEGEDYSGPSAMSEVETQLIDKLISENTDAIFALDHHNFNTLQSDGHVCWFGSRSDSVHDRIFSLSNYLDGYIKKKFNWITENNPNNSNKNLFCIKSSVNGGLASTLVGKYGVEGMILETISGWGSDYEGTTQDLQSFMVDVIGNLLLTVTINN